MRTFPRRYIAAALPALVAGALTAQEAADANGRADHGTIEEEIVVSATLIETERRQVGASVTVIDREQIERRRSATVAELLRTVPGVEIVQTGGAGGATSAFLRGANSAHTLVLLDGVRVNSPLGGAFDWADLTTDLVERVEVVRGPQSALYGSEAIGGVISIVSRSGRDGELLEGGAEAGSLGGLRVWAAAAGSRRSWDWSLAASHQEADGVSRASEAAGNTEDDPWENRTFAATVGRPVMERGEARLSLRYTDSEAGLDGFDFVAGPVDDPNFVQERQSTTASLALELPAGDRWRSKIRLGYSDETLETSDPDPGAIFNNSRLESTTSDLELQTDVELGAAAGLSVGASYESREGSNQGNLEEDLDLLSFFAETRATVKESLTLTAGLRHDDHSIFGGETTWRLTASWLAGEGGTRVHASAGTGFKAPTLVDLYFPFFGNLDLEPERSEGFDLGVEQSWLEDRLVVDLTWFDSQIEELIVFDFSTFLAGNVAEAEIEGVEAQAAWRPGGRYDLTASYTRTDSEDVATGEQLVRRPKHRGVLSLGLRPARGLDAVVSLIAVRDRVDVGDAPLDDYERLDATVTYTLNERWAIYLRGRNLLDQDYEEVLGFTTPGAEVVFGARVRR